MNPNGEDLYPLTRSCDVCAEYGRVRLYDPADGNSAYICWECDERQEAAIKAALDAAHGFDVATVGEHVDCPLSTCVRKGIAAYNLHQFGGPSDGGT